jgi:predicted DNA-binding protein (MmcQ/YjbR family)
MAGTKGLATVAKRLRDVALAFPETDEAFPWGEQALRVRGKAFVFMRLENDTLSFSVKLPRSRRQALTLPFVEPTHYGLGKHGWVTVTATKVDAPLQAQFEEWIAESFEAVAPRKLVDAAKGSPAKAAPRMRGARAPARSSARKR